MDPMPQTYAENPLPLRFVVHPPGFECEPVTPVLFPPERRGPFKISSTPLIAYAIGTAKGMARGVSPVTGWVQIPAQLQRSRVR
jgi:hypothetical protein